MKTFLLTLFCTAMLLTSCNNKQPKNESENSSEEITKSAEDTDFKEAKNCDEFIDQYEKWMDDYIVLLDKYMKNPMDPKLMEQYMNVAQESMNWMNQWNSKLIYCSSKDKYQKRFDEISEKADKKLKELGLE